MAWKTTAKIFRQFMVWLQCKGKETYGICDAKEESLGNVTAEGLFFQVELVFRRLTSPGMGAGRQG